MKSYKDYRKPLLMLTSILMAVVGNAQEPSLGVRNIFYCEFENRKPVYSLNYEHIFHESAKLKYSYRAGFAVGLNNLYFPLGISAMTGKKASHLAFDLVVAPYLVKYTVAERGSTKVWDTYVYVLPAAGYRYHLPQGGLFFKVSASPGILLDIPSRHYFDLDPELQPSVFLGVGYCF